MTDCTCNNFPASLGNVTFGASVGIGTSAPRALLSFGTAVQTNTVYLYDAGDGAVYGFGIAPNTLQIYSSGAITTAIAFGTYDGSTFAEGMRLQAGRLGVGTTSPAAALEVDGDRELLRLNGSGNTVYGLLTLGGTQYGQVGVGQDGNTLTHAQPNSLAIRAERALHLSGGGDALTLTVMLSLIHI